MSYYEDERRRSSKPTQVSVRRDYDDDDSYYSRRPAQSTSLTKRRDSYDDVDEEITRDFSPPGGARSGFTRETTVRRSGVRPSGGRARSYDDDDRYFDDRYDDKSYISSRRSDRYDDRRDDKRRSQRYRSDYDSRSSSGSRTPPRRDRRKSKSEDALEALGLGGVAAALLGKKERSRSRDRDSRRSGRSYSESRSTRSKSRTREQLTNALKAAVLAGAGEAFRVRKEGGAWSGDKGKRVLTAAFSAGGVDGLIGANRDNPERHNNLDAVGSAIAGMATSRIVNGPRSQSRGRGGSPDNRRGRSSSRGAGLGNLAAGGAVAAAAKKVFDGFRSQSRGQSRGRDNSRSPSDRGGNQPRSKSRRRSVSRAAARGLAALGLDQAAEKMDPDRGGGSGRKKSRRDSNDYSSSRGPKSGYGYDDDDYDDGYRDDVGQPRSRSVNGGGRARDASQSRSDMQVAHSRGQHGEYSLDYGPRHNGDPDTDSDSDLGSSTDEEKEIKKGRRKSLLTTGLATIATIHAGHSVYQSYEKHQANKKAVREGEISKEQAKRNQNRDRLQEAASVGLAALGIKGAYSEWKEMKEHNDEFAEEKEKIMRHKAKREARRKKAAALLNGGPGYSDSGYASSMPNLHSPPPQHGPYHPNTSHPAAAYDGRGPYGGTGQPPPPQQPMYYDDNPYGGGHSYQPTYTNDGMHAAADGSPFPPPPVGYTDPYSQSHIPPAADNRRTG